MSSVSFELFPPRTPEAEQRLWEALPRLESLAPSFMSVTCGAGGSSNSDTLEALGRLSARTATPLAGHLTCVGRSRAQADAEALRYWDAGVRHIVAVRGDAPGDDVTGFEPHPDGYRSSLELVRGIRALRPFEVSVGAYPERHPESRSPELDLDLLARKADAGATRAITQFCYHSDAIVGLRDRLDAAGVAIKLVPGVLLASDFGAAARMAQRCGANVPSWLGIRFAGLEDDLTVRRLVAAVVASEQVARLRSEGFDEFHFYTLNRSELAQAVCATLAAEAETEAVAA